MENAFRRASRRRAGFNGSRGAVEQATAPDVVPYSMFTIPVRLGIMAPFFESGQHGCAPVSVATRLRHPFKQSARSGGTFSSASAVQTENPTRPCPPFECSADTGDERCYRQHFLRQDALALLVLIGLVMVFSLLCLRADYLFLRGDAAFVLVLSVRLGVIGFSAWTMAVILRTKEPRQLDRWSFAWGGTCALAHHLIVFFLPAVYTGYVVVDLLMIVAWYSVQPCLSVRGVAPAVLYTLGSLYLFFSVKAAMGFVASLSTVTAYAGANTIGWIVSANWHRYRKSSFLARQTLEQLYRASEERRRAAESAEQAWVRIIDTSENLLFVIDRTFRILRVNLAFARRLGISKEEVVGRRCYELLCRHREPLPSCPLHAIILDHQPRTVETILPPWNFDCRMMAAPLLDASGQHEATVFIIQDISEHKRSERELRAAREQYQSLVQNSHGIIYTISPHGVVTYVSPGYTKLLGHEPDHIVGKHFREIVHPDDVALCEDFYREVWEHGEIRRGLEYRIPHRDGSIRWHLSNFIPLTNEEGEIESFVGNAMDITEQKQHQAELQAAREAAEAASRAKSDFLALISHEIRTPLNAIVGFSALARRTADGVQLREYVDILDQSSRLLMDLVNDVLDMSKVEAGQLQLESIPFNLPEAVDLLQWQFAPVAARKQLDFQVIREETLPPWIQGDPIRFRQIASNLLSNAMKFTESGCVLLRVTAQDQAPGVEGRCLVRLEVRDTGIGIEARQIASLFQPFQQLDPGISRKYGGTGLGLAIVHRLVELMQGRVEVASTPGTGSSFTVELPFVLSSPPQYERMAAPPIVPLTILVIEDNVFNRRLLHDTLSSWGHKVCEAASALQAMELLDTGRYDCIVLDVRMPEIDGVELAVRLRQLERLCRLAPTPIIAYTADTEGETRKRCLAAGMQAVLFKPLDPQLLALAIGEHCGPLASTAQPPASAPASTYGLRERIVADMGHDTQRMAAYFQLLWDDIGNELNRLDQAVLLEDRKLFQEAAHSLKGLCGYLQDRGPEEAAVALHDGAWTLPLQEMHGLVKQLRALCVRPVLPA